MLKNQLRVAVRAKAPARITIRDRGFGSEDNLNTLAAFNMLSWPSALAVPARTAGITWTSRE